ncbi:MAG: hypothetical protein GVY19_13240 [Bacteroidetes bacterium]|jgi:hypothetical protein|nr:hypothetical protein [Bacteroidota bacterium]
MNRCLECNEPLTGRSDKKYCNPYCKSAYQYRETRKNETNLYLYIDKKLKKNRKILKNFNKAGKAIIREQDLLAAGFDPRHFTHYFKTKGGNIYLFCYEYGYMKIKENGKTKYVLVKWQKYMVSKHP